MNQDNTLCLHITKRVEEANYSLHYVANGVKVQRTKQLFTSKFWPQEKNIRKFLTEHWRKGLRRDAKECFIPISWNIWKALYAWRIVRGRWVTYYVNVMGHFSIISYFVRIQTEMFFFSGDYDFWYRKIPRTSSSSRSFLFLTRDNSSGQLLSFWEEKKKREQKVVDIGSGSTGRVEKALHERWDTATTTTESSTHSTAGESDGEGQRWWVGCCNYIYILDIKLFKYGPAHMTEQT